MVNGTITSTNLYNFTFAFPEAFDSYADRFLNGPYSIYDFHYYLLPWLILHSLNVNLVLMKDNDLKKALLNINIKWDSELSKHTSAVKSGERDDTELLSIQGLGDLVWVLVALSLMAVSAVTSYIGKRNKMRRESHFTSFAESLWIHAADLINNSVACAKKVAVPLRYVRAWWLLGVAILIQFWCAGLKSDLLADDLSIIDSLEDLMSNPKIICYYLPAERIRKLLEDVDSKYIKLRQQLRENEHVLWKLGNKENEKFISGKAVVLHEVTSYLKPALFQKLKRNNRKLYVGKTNYEEFYTHMFFNQRLPRDIKERIDYL